MELTSSKAEKLKAEIQTGRFRCARQVREWLQATLTVAYSLSGIKRLLQRLGCSFHKTTGFPFKAKRDKQEEFVQKYEADRPAEGAATRRYFVDACHPMPEGRKGRERRKGPSRGAWPTGGKGFKVRGAER